MSFEGNLVCPLGTVRKTEDQESNPAENNI